MGAMYREKLDKGRSQRPVPGAQGIDIGSLCTQFLARNSENFTFEPELPGCYEGIFVTLGE
jgi:hypothetical protein